MNRCCFFILISFLWFISCHSAISEPKNFNEQGKDSLLVELEERFEEINRQHRDTAFVLLDTLNNLWINDKFNKSQKETIKNTFTSFEGMRMSTWPDEAIYIRVLVEVINTTNAEENFKVIHESSLDLLTIRNQRRFINFLEKSLMLFKNNVLFETNVVKWKFSNEDYYLEFDSLLRVNFDSKGELICYSQKDSMIVRETSGQFELFEDKWYGNQGIYTWERVEVSPDSVFAEFDNYEVDLTKPRFNIDSVKFTNYNFFSTPLKGELEERVVSDTDPKDDRYPRFTSYKAIHEIEDLFPDINYIGGFTMSGQRVLGTSAEDRSAKLDIYRNDSLFVTALAETFSIRDDRIISNRAAVSIYLAGDSIHHPGINMRYLNAGREFSLYRDETGTSQAPFYNTYHELDMYCGALYWNIDEPNVEFRNTRNIGDAKEAVFESNDFFSELRYMRLQGLEDMHPLVRLSRYSREVGSREFSIKEYASHIRISQSNVKSQLISLSYYGFLSIDLAEEKVILNDRLFHYTGAYAGNNDFDVMQITSEAPLNAEVNLHNFDLNVHGVDKIPLSDSKNVIIHPYGETVTMHKNRDIYFHGRIESGLFDFYGKEFAFDYDDFKIELINTDSMSFRVRSHEPDSRGEYSYVRVRTVLEGINGELLVDHPDNKSGDLPYPRYPVFNSESESHVYYDHDYIHDGVYEEEKVYFKVTPFTIDSLDHATTENIAFDGVFVSEGILPDIDDYLTVQPDYSLGINTSTPEEGYAVYDGKAHYTGPINMSYEGLETSGQLKYLNASVEAKHMLMFPDSARADVNLFILEPQSEPVEYPSVRARDADMLYLPFEDDLAINYVDRPIEIFGGLANVRGDISVTPEGLDGKGNLEIFDGEMLSDKFDLRQNEMESSNTTLEFKAPDKEETNLKLHGYETYVNVSEGKGNFIASSDTSFIELPANRYVAFMDEIDWDEEKQQMHMYNQRGRDKFDLGNLTKDELIDMDFDGFEFISMDRSQDSLRFYVDNAVFEQQTSQVHAKGVNIIKVADAAIFPNNEEVSILPEAEIEQLDEASIIADTNTRYHQMHNARIDIESRNYYEGIAYYDYVNERNEVHELFFEQLYVNDEGQTQGLSRTYKDDEFYVSTMFPFKGDINLKSTKQHFNYDGASKILAEDCGLLQPTWFRFDATLNPDSVMIPVSEDLQDANYDDLKTSIMLAGDSLHIYPAMFSERQHYLDQEIISAHGFLTYDRMINHYVLTTKEKHIDNDLPDNLIRINPNACEIRAEGDVTFHDDIGQVNIDSYGNVIYDLNENDLELDIVMALDFHFADECLDIVKDSIKEASDLNDINLNRQKYIKAMYDILGVEEGSKLLTQLGLGGNIRRFPEELNHNFFFADIKLRWNQENKSFVSHGPLGLGNIQETLFNKYIDGFFEYHKQRGGDVLTFYFEPRNELGNRPGGLWFYYRYTRGVMQTVSVVNEYNKVINETRSRDRRLDVERGEESYTFNLAPDYRPFEFFQIMYNFQNNENGDNKNE